MSLYPVAPDSDLTLVFDPIAHRYTHGTRELISVTQALTAAGLVDTQWYTEEACDRGRRVHAWIAQHARGHVITLPDPAAPERPFVEAYLRFRRETDVTISTSERQVCDLALGYAGTYDALGLIGARPALFDWKTGSVPAWVGLQLAAYRRCLPLPFGIARYSVELRSDATYRLTEWRDKQDEQVFIAAVTLMTWKRRQA